MGNCIKALTKQDKYKSKNEDESPKKKNIGEEDEQDFYDIGVGNRGTNKKHLSISDNKEHRGNTYNERKMIVYDWKGRTRPEYIYYLCAMPGENFIACTDNQVQIFHLDDDSNGDNTYSFNHKLSIDAHSKIVNMCDIYKGTNVFTCSREPIIKLFDLTLGEDAPENRLLSDFKGHDMSVTTVSSNLTMLASGSRDQTTRLWDIET